MYIVFVYLVPILLGILLGFKVENMTLNAIILISYAFGLGLGFGYLDRKRD